MGGLLAGVTVVDVSRVLAAPFATQMLSDFGAAVYKVEALAGDDTRRWGQHYFDAGNRGKRSLAINLKDKRGARLVASLAGQADVFVENFKVGDLARYGLDYSTLSALNERLVYLSVTGFGQTGPRKDQLGYDSVIQGMTGIMTATGEPDHPPAKVGIAWIDVMSGLAAVIGILGALYERTRSGKGQQIDLSLFDVGVMALIDAGMDYLQNGNVQTRTGSVHRNFAPAQTFLTADGWVTLAVGTDDQFRRLCEVMGLNGLTTDRRFADNQLRLAHRDELAGILGQTFASRPRSHWVDAFARCAVPLSPVNDIAEAFADPQSIARNLRWCLEGGSGPMSVLANPLQHMSRTPAAPAGPPPMLGEHTRQALVERLGMGLDELRVLEREGVIYSADQATEAKA